MNEEFTDAQISELLNTYGDAIESQVVQGNDLGAQDVETANTTNQGGTWLKGNDMANNEMADSEMAATAANEELPLLDAGVSSMTPEKAGRGRALVGALAITAVALVGGAFVLNATFSDDGTTETASEVEESEDDVATDQASAVQDDAAVDDNAATSEPSGESPSGTSQPAPFLDLRGAGGVLFVDGEFVSLGSDADGVVVARSTDGLDWTVEQTVGFPELASAEGLVRTEDGWAALATQFELQDQPTLFGEPRVSARWLATSTDLVNWTTVELPTFDDEADFTFVSGFASSGNTIAILGQPELDQPDETEILFNAGLITEEDVENFCGSEFNDGGPFIAFTCDFSSENSDRVELVRLEPGDPVYDEIAAINDFENFEPSALLVMAGPVSGPFEVIELPVSGFGSSLVGSDAGFSIAVSDFDSGESSVLFSDDGLDWATSESTIEGTDAISSLAESNGTLAAVGQIFAIEGSGTTVPIFTSADSGATWSETSIPTALFGGFGQVSSGPAGFAVSITGTVEPGGPFAEFGEGAVVELQSDGYTMVMPLDFGEIELFGPDGQSVYGPISQDVFFDESTDGPIRFEGPGDETLIWLDPETGEDLVSFDESDFDAALEEIAPGFEDEPVDFGDQEQVTELWFSVDGQTWTLAHTYTSSFDSSEFTSVGGVGDDELLLRTETFGQPPAELFAFESEGREPTAEEEAALDEWFANQSEPVTWEAIPIG